MFLYSTNVLLGNFVREERGSLQKNYQNELPLLKAFGRTTNYLLYFGRTKVRSVSPDRFTFPFVIWACADLKDLWRGMWVQGLVFKFGVVENWMCLWVQVRLNSNLFWGSGGCPAYARWNACERCGRLDCNFVGWSWTMAAIIRFSQQQKNNYSKRMFASSFCDLNFSPCEALITIFWHHLSCPRLFMGLYFLWNWMM